MDKAVIKGNLSESAVDELMRSSAIKIAAAIKRA